MEHGSPSFSPSDPSGIGNPSKIIEAQSNPENNNVAASLIEEPHLPPPTKDEEPLVSIRSLTRIMRDALPMDARISNDAKESVQMCVSEFIGIITIEASKRCASELRKAITGEDLIRAMESLGFEDYIGPLTLYLQNYRNHEAQFTGKQMTHGFSKDGSRAGGSSSSGNSQY